MSARKSWQRTLGRLSAGGMIVCSLGGGPGWSAEITTVPPVMAAEFRVTTPDSVELVMTWMSDRLEDSVPAPVVMLLPMMNSDRSSWHGLDTMLVEQGFTVVSVDQRGHGASTSRAGKRYHWRDFSDQEFLGMVRDIGTILASAEARAVDSTSSQVLDSILAGADFSRVILIGASIGTSAALLYAAEHQEIAALVLLSPGLEYRGLVTGPAMEHYRGRPIYLTAAKDDTRSAQAVAVLLGKARIENEQFVTQKIHPGKMHGTDLFEVAPSFREELIRWVVKVLRL